jgi:hypothetical protein
MTSLLAAPHGLRLTAWRQEINASTPTKNNEQEQAAKARKGKKKQKKKSAGSDE